MMVSSFFCLENEFESFAFPAHLENLSNSRPALLVPCLSWSVRCPLEL
jgi:hypothetical protein